MFYLLKKLTTFENASMKERKKHLPPASIATRTIPHDQISAGAAAYLLTKTSGAT